MDDAAPITARPIADPLERAMAHVETHAFEPLGLTDLAAVAGLSPYHFARQFNARYGLTPMAFVRARRLGLAARLLAAPDPPSLVNLAFDTGFETQEGFTRAFKRAFGVSPGRYRRVRGAPLPQVLQREDIPMTETAHAPRVSQAPVPVRKPAFRVAGVSAVFDETSKAGIPLLWQQLGPRLPLPGQVGKGTYGVGCPTDAPDGGCFRYAASVAIAPDAPVPDGLEAFEVPAQTYLVFRLDTDASPLHPQMQAAHRRIWGELVPQSGFKLANGPDLEVYPPDFQGHGPAQLEWWIPIEA